MSIQDILSVAQAVPIVGPLIISPIKMGVSLIQIIAELARCILCGIAAPFAFLFGNHTLGGRLSDWAAEGFMGALTGAVHLIYATANLGSLGILGLCIEGCIGGHNPIYIPKCW